MCFPGLPEQPNTDEFKAVFKRVESAHKGEIQPITVLSALLRVPEDAITLNLRLKFTVFERELSYFLTQNREEFKEVDELL